MSAAWFPQNKEELMTAIDHEWNALLQAAGKLTTEQMQRPDAGGWSPKDNLAHLSEWMRVLMDYHIGHLPGHEVLRVPEEVTKGWDFNHINRLLFERNRNRSTADVLDELKRVHAGLIARLNSMSYEDMLKPRHPDDPGKGPLMNWILGDTTEHFAEHRATIEKSF